MFKFKAETIVRPNGLTASVQTATFAGILKSISNAPVGVTSGGKDFYVGTVEFPDANGQPIERGCIIYGANHDYGMEVGEKYLCRVTINPELPTGDKNRVTITMSHLTSATAALATDSDFGVLVKAAIEEVEEVE